MSDYPLDIDSKQEYTVFSIGESFYAIDINGVQEISRYANYTPVYNVPDVKGLINLRGQAVTVIDLRMKLNQSVEGSDKNKPLIIVTLKKERVALLVDKINDAVFIAPDQILPPPSNIKSPEKQIIAGVHKKESGIVIILDKDAILSQ